MVSVKDQRACKIQVPEMLESDVITGSAQHLPGKVKIIAGPGYAKPDGSDVAPVQKGVDPVQKQHDPLATPDSDSKIDNGNVFKVDDATSTLSSTSSSIYSMEAESSPSSSSSSTPEAIATTSSVPVPPPPPPAAITSAPAAPANNNAGAVDPGLSTISTSRYTVGQQVYEVIVVAEEVTVTMPAGEPTPVPGVKGKRDFLHRHGRRHGHHGGRHQ